MSAQELARSVWDVDADDFPADAPVADRARFCLRYAILAPSSHNAQPWRFRVDGNVVHVAADESRWLEVADPDRRELFVSLGCAVENLVVAAEEFGFDPTVAYCEGDGAWIATVTLGGSGDGVRRAHDRHRRSDRPCRDGSGVRVRRPPHQCRGGRRSSNEPDPRVPPIVQTTN